MDEAKLSTLHYKVISLIAAGYFFDVIDLIVLGALIPDMIASKFATPAEAAWIGSATVFGMFIGGIAQGEFSDRWGRKTVYQFNLLIFGVFTILGAMSSAVSATLPSNAGLRSRSNVVVPEPVAVSPAKLARMVVATPFAGAPLSLRTMWAPGSRSLGSAAKPNCRARAALSRESSVSEARSTAVHRSAGRPSD